MATFPIQILVHYSDIVHVEADSLDEAMQIVRSADFSVFNDQVVDHDVDLSPEIEVLGTLEH